MVQTGGAHELLRRQKEVILKRWSSFARDNMKASSKQTSRALTNSLPAFIDRLAEALDPSFQISDASEDKSISFQHGVQRASLENYSLDEVVHEYLLLQETIINTLKESGEITADECSIIARSFLGAARDAASAFVNALNEKHQKSEFEFKRLVEDAKDLAIFFMSPDGIIQTWNEGATRIKQFTAEDAIGHHYRMLYREEDRQLGRPEHNLRLALENGRVEEQWWRIKKDGSLWWAEAILTTIYDSAGNPIGISKMVRDLTEKKRIDDELREAKAAADEANKLKSTFVANMSHEIRTPLGVVLGFAQVLKDDRLTSEEREQFASIIDRNGKMLLRLIDDILDLSKVEAGKLDFQIINVTLRTVMPEITGLFETQARDKGLMLDLSLDEKVPDYIYTDPIRFRQIISNLLSNAIKFTSKGGVKVFVRPSDRVGFKGIDIFVTDTGSGLADHKRDRLFGEFSQADASITRKYGGTGLGLALSRKLARELGGDLVLGECDEGSGCTFQVTIADKEPKRAIQNKDEVAAWKKAQSNNESYPDLRGSNILLVEDSPDNQALVRHILSKEGAIVEIAENGVEGVKKASSGEFDLVLMDMQMPLMDGNQAVQALREQGYTQPIIAVSAHAMIEDRVKSLNAGCDDYISKPLRSRELLNLVQKWMNQVHH